MDSQKCCSRQVLVTDKEMGEMLCSGCGTVLEENLFYEDGNGIAVTHDGVKMSHEAPMDTTVSTSDTYIALGGMDTVGKQISFETYQNFKRMKIWDGRIKGDGVNRNFPIAANQIVNVMKKMNMGPDKAIEANRLLKKYMGRGLTRGRSMAEAEGGIVYAMSKKYRMGRNLKDIAENLNIRASQVLASYRIVLENFRSEVAAVNNGYSENQSEMDSYLSNITSKISMPSALRERTEAYVKKIMKLPGMERYREGKNRMVLNAAVIYYVGARDTSLSPYLKQITISKAAGVSGVGMRNNFKHIVKIVGASSLADQL